MGFRISGLGTRFVGRTVWRSGCLRLLAGRGLPRHIDTHTHKPFTRTATRRASIATGA